MYLSKTPFVTCTTAVALSLATFTLPRVASADLLTLQAEARVGLAAGKGLFGERKDEAFQEGSGAGTYGVRLGAEVAWIDGWIQHMQYLGSDGVSGTWTEFMLGFDTTIGFGGLRGFSRNATGAPVGGYHAWFAELGMGFGFGVGTGQQVNPPLDNSEVTDKGALFETRTFVGYRFTHFLAVGASLPLHFGYFLKSGPGTFANNKDNHYTAMGGELLAVARVDWNLF